MNPTDEQIEAAAKAMNDYQREIYKAAQGDPRIPAMVKALADAMQFHSEHYEQMDREFVEDAADNLAPAALAAIAAVPDDLDALMNSVPQAMIADLWKRFDRDFVQGDRVDKIYGEFLEELVGPRPDREVE